MGKNHKGANNMKKISLLLTICMLAVTMIACSTVQKVFITECPACHRLDEWFDYPINTHTCEDCGHVYNPQVSHVYYIEL